MNVISVGVEGVVKVAPGPLAVFICSIKKSVNRSLKKAGFWS